MILSTTDSRRPYSCPVFFGVDETFCLYIVSPPETKHVKNFLNNNQVSCVVTDTSQKVGSSIPKIGAQIDGVITQVTDNEKVAEALLVWTKDDKEKANDFYKKITNNEVRSRVYIIHPREIKWFNEKLYGREGTKIFKLQP